MRRGLIARSPIELPDAVFDARIARPFLVLLALNFVGLLCAVARCVRFPTFTVSRGLSLVNWPAHLYDGHHFGIVAVNDRLIVIAMQWKHS